MFYGLFGGAWPSARLSKRVRGNTKTALPWAPGQSSGWPELKVWPGNVASQQGVHRAH